MYITIGVGAATAVWYATGATAAGIEPGGDESDACIGDACIGDALGAAFRLLAGAFAV